MVQSRYSGWNRWVYTESAWESHIVLLYEWLQNYFETKERIGREWCKIPPKARTANPSATTMLAVAQCQMFVKRHEYKEQHVENISQMYGKNSWGFCHRSNQKETRSANPFEGARQLTWLLEKHITMPPVGEITLEMMTGTRKSSKTLKPLKSKPRPSKHYFQ